eukprot:CAMPEP_0201739082 /NCGR_PEP_ID=MMETSP0593-20130828/45592_1 /ASSEMBLY_ACC=CAM_ASM_000672 /TAXON_ID=267983 /ORGANISM="Skeletonema japonicum, Strain CCMP2506" /LENGTH=370 /DNA_ID=CAMNT_0048233329 /DNA_START=391 /DNA_END=1504 /DNA_ORIENTATION=+
MFSSSQSNNKIDDPANQLSTVDIHAAQTQLLKEANYLTKTLYRKCLKSIQSLARGNERDESDFSEREQSEKDQLDELLSDSSSSSKKNANNNRVSLMSPPVNRQNELSSRANYYQAFTREHFDGHWNLLGKHGFHLGEEGNMRHGLGNVGGEGGQEGNRYEGGHHHLGGQMAAQYSSHQKVASFDSDDSGKVMPQQQLQQYYMWREEQIEQFTYLITSGEEKRQWILSDYGGQEGNRYEGDHHHMGGQMAAQYSSHRKVASFDSDDSSKVIPQQHQQQYYMWREEQIEQFTYLITSGEEKRQWILSDYEFKDPCSKHWPEELRTRIQQFEESANALVKEMYRKRGWIHSSDHEQYEWDASEDSDSDDEDF